MSPYTNFHYLERRLAVHFLTEEHTTEQELRHIFVYRYLQGDGTFMLRLLATNVNDYACSKIILELYKKFRTALLNNRIGRESLFQPISKDEDEDNLNDDDDESTDQTIADIPPIPNPRHGRIFIERDSLPHSSSDASISEQHEPRRTVSFTLPPTIDNEQIHLRNSPLTQIKDIRHKENIQMDSSDRLNLRHISEEFHLGPETTLLSTPPSPASFPPLRSSTTIKSTSPYATTYLTTKTQNEQELPYVDDSISGSSTSDRLASATTTRPSQKSTTILTSTNPLYRRSHDV
jgi:hypothetical protein